MPMVSRVRNALRRLIDDYGSSDEDKDKDRGSVAPKTKRKNIFFRPFGTGLKSEISVDDHSSSSTDSSENDTGASHATQLPAGSSESADLPGFIGSNHVLESTGGSPPAANGRGEGGRIRDFEHFPGTWATYVHLVARIDGLIPLFKKLIDEASNATDIKWSMVEEPHISLSKTVPFRYHEIPHFTAHLKSEIMKTSLPRFSYTLENIEIFTNEKANTSFLSLTVGRGQKDMLSLLKIVDTCLKAFKMPTFYENPQFHLSFAWSTQLVTEEQKNKITSTLQEKLEELQSDFAGDLVENAKAVHCKSGNRTYLIPL